MAPHFPSIKSIVALTLICIGSIAVAGLLSSATSFVHTPNTRTSTTAKAPPPFTESTRAKLAALPQFDVVVSYTDLGFAPNQLIVPAGTVIRFTNNSSHRLWIKGDTTTGALHPRTADDCGASGIDSCGPLDPQDFWQMRVELVGTWGFQNGIDKADTGSITVVPNH